jgi:hypothetical protein
MTTRRWMVVVAALAAALGGYLEVARLIERRAEFRQRAKVHAGLEAYYHKQKPNAAYVAHRKKMLESEQDLAEFEADQEAEFRRLIERMFGRSTESLAPFEEDLRFREAQARARMLRVRSIAMALDYLLKRTEFHQRQAQYHAVLTAKYEAAASRPWLSVAPDPPPPK